MELNSTNTTMRNNFENAKAFTAEVSSITFQMFSSMIYQHKKAAFVRELVSNAVDSHIEANKRDTAIVVTLPNYGNPYFMVEDFGVGLDEESFESIYTCYTKSTKRDSNLGIGGFGVGSKSPFAYTNSFQIRVRKNGKEIMFNAFQNENSEPAFAKIYERVTDEPNGVLVKVPVKQQDFQEIANLTSYYLSFFDMKFDVKADGTFKYEYEGIPEDLNKHGYALRPLTYSYGYRSRSNVLIVMGGVPYEYNFDFGQLDSIDRQVLGSQQIFLKFEIGELKVALSRESLSLDENTAQLVVDKLSGIASRLIEHLQEEVDAQENVLEAIKFVLKKYGSYGFAFSKFTYKGKKMRPHRTFLRQKSIGMFRGYNHRASAATKMTIKETIEEQGTISFVYQADEKHTKAIQKYAKAIARETYRSVVFYYRDGVLSPHMIERYKKLLSGLNVNFYTTEELKLKYTDPSIRNKVAAGKRVRIGDEKAWGVSWVADGSNFSYYNREVIDLSNDDVVFLYADDEQFEGLKNTFGSSLIALSFLLGEDDDFQKIRVIRRNTQNAKKLEKNEVQNVSDFIRDFTDDLNQVYVGNACKNRLDPNGQLNDNILRVIDQSDDPMYADLFKQIKKHAKNSLFYVSFYDFLPFALSDETKKVVQSLQKLDHIKEEAIKKYGILSAFDGYYYGRWLDNNLNEIVEYVNYQYQKQEAVKNRQVIDLSLAA